MDRRPRSDFVGPSPEDLVKAISREDIHRIVAVPGVGAKLAERIVRELRDKIANLKFGGEERRTPAQAAASDNGMGTIVTTRFRHWSIWRTNRSRRSVRSIR